MAFPGSLAEALQVTRAAWCTHCGEDVEPDLMEHVRTLLGALPEAPAWRDFPRRLAMPPASIDVRVQCPRCIATQAIFHWCIELVQAAGLDLASVMGFDD